MKIENVYVNDDGYVVELTGPIDVELVVLSGFDVAVWRDSESGDVLGDVVVGIA